MGEEGGGQLENVILGPAQERGAAAALAASLTDYPSFRFLFPDQLRRRQAVRAFFTAIVRDGLPFGSVHAVLHGARALGVAVWLPPGAFPWSVSRKVRAAPLFLRVVAADPASFPTFMRYTTNAERSHPYEPHWYLEVLGVRPEAQRRGIGTRLVEPVLAVADREGLPCYLETAEPANVSYYQRFGFGVVDDALALVPNGPRHVAMRRPVGGGPGTSRPRRPSPR